MKKDRIEAAKAITWEQLGLKNGVICSLLREDKKPSLSLYSRSNKSYWKDQATGEGGSVIDFVMQWKGLSLPEAILFIENLISGKMHLQAQLQTPVKQARKSADVDFTIMPSNIKAREYLINRRHIAPIALENVKFLTITIHNTKYDNLYVAFPVNSEKEKAYECRAIEPSNPVKQCKIKPAGLWQHGTGDDIIVTESIIDALSWRSLFPYAENEALISLNSTANLRQLFELNLTNRRVILALDNDKTGEKATQEAKGRIGILAEDARGIYRGFKDLNELLVAKK